MEIRITDFQIIEVEMRLQPHSANPYAAEAASPEKRKLQNGGYHNID